MLAVRDRVLHSHRHLEVSNLVLREYLLRLVVVYYIDLIPNDKCGVLLPAPVVALLVVLGWLRGVLLLWQAKHLLMTSVLLAFILPWLASAVLLLHSTGAGLVAAHNEPSPRVLFLFWHLIRNVDCFKLLIRALTMLVVLCVHYIVLRVLHRLRLYRD